MFFCTDRTQSFDPVSLIPNGFCYTFECESDADIKDLPTDNIREGSTALVFQKGQDTKLFKLFSNGWGGPY